MENAVLRSKKLTDDTWVIYIGNTTAYLIAGDNEGMMIDSGDTPCALREYCEDLCGKPVRMVANTHGHFDHTGGNGYFEVAYMGKLAAEIARTPNGKQDASLFPVDDYEIVIVDEGFKIDLGNREIETFMLDGHSPDSTAYLDKKMRLLFVGDNMGKAPLKYKCADPQPSVLRYAINVAKLMARREEYDWVLRGHEDFMHDAQLVNRDLVCALRAAELDCDPEPPRPARPGGGPKMGSGNPEDNGYVAYKSTHLSFDKRYATDLTCYNIVKGT